MKHYLINITLAILAVFSANMVLAGGGFDENGVSISLFSVSDNNKVFFSKGNLQYTTTGTHAVYGGGSEIGTWRFAEHQYDYIGSENSNIAASYTGWIDLFGWGTSGWNSGANAYQPWTMGQNSDYYPGGSAENDLTGAYARADWGVYNAISNGGDRPGMWRTLTEDEWVYLMETRSASTVGGTSDARFVKATVAGTKGLIIFPDSYTHPTEVAEPTYVNSNENVYGSNRYTVSQWSEMESAGAIFLPEAGYRTGTSFYTAEPEAHYWTATHYSEAKSYTVYSFRIYFGADGQNERRLGQSVRLVVDESNYHVEGINDVVCFVDVRVYSRDGRIVVEQGDLWAAGNNLTIAVYDIMGRMVKQSAVSGHRSVIPVPGRGVYMVKVGDARPHKVMVKGY